MISLHSSNFRLGYRCTLQILGWNIIALFKCCAFLWKWQSKNIFWQSQNRHSRDFYQLATEIIVSQISWWLKYQQNVIYTKDPSSFNGFWKILVTYTYIKMKWSQVSTFSKKNWKNWKLKIFTLRETNKKQTCIPSCVNNQHTKTTQK